MEILSITPDSPDFILFNEILHYLYPANSIRLQQSENINLDYLKSAFILMHEGKPMARLCLYIPSDFFYNGQRAACIGNYEAIDDDIISKSLLDHATQVAREAGCQYLIGPMNGSTWDAYRFSISQIDDPFFSEPVQQGYYHTQFEKQGFVEIASYISEMDSALQFDFSEIVKKEAEFFAKGMVIRNLEKASMEKELEKIYPMVMEAFHDNFLFTPISKEAFVKRFGALLQKIDASYTFVAESAAGEMVGFLLAYPDLYSLNEKRMVLKTLARRSMRQWMGLGQVLGNYMVRKAKSDGYTSIIHAFMKAQAGSTLASKKFNGSTFRNYVLYGKSI